MFARLVMAVLLTVSVNIAAQLPSPNSEQKPAGSRNSAEEAPLLAKWSSLPKLFGNAVAGSLVVTNHTEEEFDQTVIVVAVNGIGEAFTLGYQHFRLPAHSESTPIKFTTTLPPGSYQVRADAVAEVPSRHAIYRQHLLAPAGFVIESL